MYSTLPAWPPISSSANTKRQGLKGLQYLLAKLGNPHKHLPPVIHIAGTNGKGSTVAILRAIFTQAGYRVHSYTSPHLLHFNERINLNGDNIAPAYLDKLSNVAKAANQHNPDHISFFDGITAMAFLAFAEQPADILLLETGLGGTIDSTNVIENPLMTIITPISYDHLEVLGTNLLDIASNKAGIIKAKTPCVISAQAPEIYELLLARCQLMQAPSFCYEYDFVAHKAPTGFDYQSAKYHLKLPKPSLAGDHQIINCATAIASSLLLNNCFKLPPQILPQAITSINWPGRISIFNAHDTASILRHLNCSTDQPLTIIIDGAHNEAGAQSLVNWLTDNLENFAKPITLIMSMSGQRTPENFIRHFSSFVQQIIWVDLDSALTGPNLSRLVSYTDIKLGYAKDLTTATKIAITDHHAGTIIISGSLLLVAQAFALKQAALKKGTSDK